jgi:hypothetical protein
MTKKKDDVVKGNMTIEKSPVQMAEDAVANTDSEKVAAAKEAYDSFGKELQTKVYLVPGGKTTGDAIVKFLEENAEWSAHESLGIVRAHEDVSAQLKKNKKELFLGGLCVEAVAYYISKASGTGLIAAKQFKDNLFMPINEVMAGIQEDKKTAEGLQLEWAAAAQGVEVEGDINNK